MTVKNRKPTRVGHYVCHVNPDIEIIGRDQKAKLIILFWDGKHFCYPMSAEYYRDTIYEWQKVEPITLTD